MCNTNNEVVYVCCNTYSGKPNKTPTKVQGDVRRADQLHKQWSNKNRYKYTDKYLNL